ncbi:membrane protein insertion efficiency factor YidD [Actinomycetaceae bacterium WB03_NA08]|uniref:Putative membrane protein insertion efficiency factor n=1 Tax=Scrofimicrobium canadense TaxID=2652290 RepID=A0A6N7VWJ6_9ACTO|nr:membrane protein insertion efficiency factor YidD [Scrofimicrobium canadense]MSS85370.1 membrane protein insertion efficiency factor YidD [Scrofimicrobium canadense]
MSGWVSQLLIYPVVLYQKYISPGLPRRCRYYPTCSDYAVQALKRHGPMKGILLATWRILRCNPWSKGGVDHVPSKGMWHAPKWVPPPDWVGYDLSEEEP